MKVDELIRQKAGELNRAHAYDPGRLDEIRSRARTGLGSRVGVLIGAALAVLLLFAPIALFLRSGDPTAEDTVTESNGEDQTPPEAAGGVSLGDRLYEMPGDGGLGSVMSSGSDLMITGWDVVLKSVDDGKTWEVSGGAPSGDDSLIVTDAAEGMLIGVGAHDGASSRLYRSADDGATWKQVELPVPPEVVQVVPHLIAHRGGEFVIAGVGTQSSFDSDVTLYLWRSPDALAWDFEQVADLDGEFAYSEAVQIAGDSLVIISRIANDSSTPTLLAFEETASGWNQTDLTPTIEARADLTSDLINARLNGVGVVDERLHTWWSFDDGAGDAGASVVAFRTETGIWEAKPVVGVAPETITVTPEGLIGTAHPGTLAPYVTPGFTAIVASSDGISWNEIGRLEGLFLRQLRYIDNRLLIAAGNETEPNDEGFVTVPSAGIWEVALLHDLTELLDSR